MADNPYLKSFDELLDDILTDYRNQELKDEEGNTIEVDTSQGSLAFVKSACIASTLWGLYKYQEYVSKQIFPDSASTENLEHHAWVRGVDRKADETDAELLTRLLTYLRDPPAGGKSSDYVKWATEVDGVASAYCYPLAQGLGTVDVVIVADADTGSETPTDTLIATVKAYIDTVRPVTASVVRVLGVTIDTQAVTMTVTGDNVDTAQILEDITAHLNAMTPSQTLTMAQLYALAVSNRAEDATITAPAANVTPADYHMLRAGVISVTAS